MLEKGRTALPPSRSGRRLRRMAASALPQTLLAALGARGRRPVDVRRSAKRAGVKVRVVDDVNSPEFLEWLASTNAELVLSAAYPQIFREELIDAVKHGCVNFHPSLLPRFRGAYPHFWAIATGARESGVTAHKMTAELDAGDIIAQRRFPIVDLDNVSMQMSLSDASEKLVDDVARFYIDRKGNAISQDESMATFYRQPGRDDVELHFLSMEGEQIYNLCRTGLAGFSTGIGWVGVANTRWLSQDDSREFLVDITPGTILAPVDNNLALALDNGVLVVERCSLNGRKLRWRRLLSMLDKTVGDKIIGPNDMSA